MFSGVNCITCTYKGSSCIRRRQPAREPLSWPGLRTQPTECRCRPDQPPEQLPAWRCNSAGPCCGPSAARSRSAGHRGNHLEPLPGQQSSFRGNQLAPPALLAGHGRQFEQAVGSYHKQPAGHPRGQHRRQRNQRNRQQGKGHFSFQNLQGGKQGTSGGHTYDSTPIGRSSFGRTPHPRRASPSWRSSNSDKRLPVNWPCPGPRSQDFHPGEPTCRQPHNSWRHPGPSCWSIQPAPRQTLRHATGGAWRRRRSCWPQSTRRSVGGPTYHFLREASHARMFASVDKRINPADGVKTGAGILSDSLFRVACQA